MKPLIANKFYVLTPRPARVPTPEQDQVLGPFDDHRAAWIARCTWAYDVQDHPDRAELLTGSELAADYLGRYGALH